MPVTLPRHERDASQWKGELLALLRLAVPVALSELGWMAMAIVDTIMVGRLGAAAIGAVSVGSVLFYSPALFGIGLLLGLDTLVSQAHGRGDDDDCHRSLAQGVYLALALSPPLMLFFWNAPPLLAAWGVNSAVRGEAGAFLRMLGWSTPPLLLYTAFRRYLQGMHRVGAVMFALLSANLVNWGANWMFIYGRASAPAMGVRGSALSTCLARAYMAAVLVAAAWWHERGSGRGLFRRWPGLDGSRMRHLLRIGAPAATQIVLEVGAFGAATVLAARLSPAALAAHQIALNCASLSYMVPLGVSAAAAVAVGHAVGAHDPHRARRAGWLAMALGAGFMGLAAVAFLLAPVPILHVYTRDPAVVRLGVSLLALAALFQLFDGVQTVATGALRGVGDTHMPMLVNLAGYWCFGLPLGYVLCFRAGWGVAGLWLGLSLALIAIAVLLLLAWNRASRRLAAPVACSSRS